jgi:hypothetical protein
MLTYGSSCIRWQYESFFEFGAKRVLTHVIVLTDWSGACQEPEPSVVLRFSSLETRSGLF